jgi:ribosomal protein S25
MSAKLSVEDVLANLEARAALHRQQEAHHRDQEAYHEQQQAHHREQRALHVAELEKVLKDLEAFRAVAESVAAQPVLRSAEPEIPPPGRNRVSRMVALVVADLPEPFGPAAVAAEASRRYAAHLSKPVDPRAASNILRRMLAEGRLELVRKGTAKREALYRRARRGGA